MISILYACRISISTVSTTLLIKTSRDDLHRIYMKNMEWSMMSRGFKYFVTSVHARFFLYHALVTNEKRGTEFAPNQFFLLRVRFRRDFKIHYKESKGYIIRIYALYYYTSMCLAVQGHTLPKRIQTRNFTGIFYRTD